MPQVQLQDGIRVLSYRPHMKNAHSWDWSEHVYGWLLQRKTQNISEPSPIQTAPTGACKGDLSGAGLQQIVSSQNSNETIQDTNLNPDDLDIDNIQFEICA